MGGAPIGTFTIARGARRLDRPEFMGRPLLHRAISTSRPVDSESLVSRRKRPLGSVGRWCHDLSMDGDRLEEAMALVADASFRPSASGDEQLLEDADRWEALGRLVDERR